MCVTTREDSRTRQALVISNIKCCFEFTGICSESVTQRYAKQKRLVRFGIYCEDSLCVTIDSGTVVFWRYKSITLWRLPETKYHSSDSVLTRVIILARATDAAEEITH